MPIILSSESDDDKTGPIKLFGREKPIRELLGGGKGNSTNAYLAFIVTCSGLNVAFFMLYASIEKEIGNFTYKLEFKNKFLSLDHIF